MDLCGHYDTALCEAIAETIDRCHICARRNALLPTQKECTAVQVSLWKILGSSMKT